MEEATRKMIEQIHFLRQKNKALYKELEDLVGPPDPTLDLIRRGYELQPRATKLIHHSILENDEAILRISKELSGCK